MPRSKLPEEPATIWLDSQSEEEWGESEGTGVKDLMDLNDSRLAGHAEEDEDETTDPTHQTMAEFHLEAFIDVLKEMRCGENTVKYNETVRAMIAQGYKLRSDLSKLY